MRLGLGAVEVGWDLLSEKINDLVVVVDASGRISYASPASRILGYEPHELIGRTGDDFVHPDDLAHFQANTAALFSGDPVSRDADREHRFRLKDGSWRWLEGNPSLIPGADGRPIGLLNVFRDVTEKRAIRDALSEQMRRASMAEDIAGVGYWRLDAATAQVTWSEQVFRMFGLEPGGRPGLEGAKTKVHPADAAASKARVAAALRSGEGWCNTPIRIIRPDGEIRHLSGRGVCEKGADGRVTFIFGTILDVTEEVVARRALEDSERRCRLLTDHASDMISRATSDGRMIYLSPSATRITGYRISELLPRQMREFVHPEDLGGFLTAYGDLISGRAEGGQTFRYRVRHKDGSWLWLESNPWLVRASVEGEPDEIIDVARNVTEQEALKARLNEALAEAERLTAVKSNFLANMSHEIRTPLTAVLGFTDLLAERPNLDPLAQSYVERIAGAGRSLLAIVNDVLDFSKLEAGLVTITLQPTAPAALCREVMEMFGFQAESKAVELRFEAAADIPEAVSLDPDRLRQILVNLIGNAMKFTDRGSVRVRVGYDRRAERLVIEVIDTGPGIAAEARQKLFRRFSQVDGSSARGKGGTGLGLAICHGLAQAMGGAVSVRSRLGRGTTFSVSLPAPPAAAAQPAEAPAAIAEDLQGVRVLVVDDHASNRELARAVLEGAGIEVSEAEDGQVAVAMAARLPFDVILMDIRMPGLDGRAAAALIRGGDGPNRRVPILAFSADADSGASQTDGASPFAGWVCKPLSPSHLLSVLHTAVNDGRASSQDEALAAAV
ncbi:MAG: multi-sensor hybrid histidine kinase [Phenylobacterium sp.]|nr:multi-sensor hybrid histidine kinase [Phenylobacterium sp.]